MTLGTFGAVLKFAIELEAIITAFYETAATITQNQTLRSNFEGFIIQGQKSILLLMRVRRENTTEMILEPISGLNSQKYQLLTECPQGCSDSQLIQIARENEEKVYAFYTEAAEKVGFLIEAADIFERLAETHQSNKRQLQTTN